MEAHRRLRSEDRQGTVEAQRRRRYSRPPPVFLDGLVVITSAHGAARPIYAIRTDASGDLTDNRSAIAWTQERTDNYMQTPMLTGGLGYFCLDNGVLTVYQLATGEKLYQQRLGDGSSGFTSSPVRSVLTFTRY